MSPGRLAAASTSLTKELKEYLDSEGVGNDLPVEGYQIVGSDIVWVEFEEEDELDRAMVQVGIATPLRGVDDLEKGQALVDAFSSGDFPRVQGEVLATREETLQLVLERWPNR
ncbi:hypothetical protein BKG82_26440 [Mycobacteroides chelonae]|uniref:Uncharacterized protein n=2 Tax=Mycobacteroides chelonae TaxID=1774 RepID=A0A1S1LHL8_MYCCH|nr:hypothetical protein BKG82_26440 [Mycobacteroides chelonae]